MTNVTDIIAGRSLKPVLPTWIELANQEISELQEAAKDDPKTFFGSRQRGMGDGLTRVRALLYASKNIEQALGQLNRGM